MILPVIPQQGQPAGAPGSILGVLGLIWFALLMGLVTFLGIAFTVSRPEPPAPELHEIFRFLVPVTAVMVVVLSYVVTPRLVAAARRKETLETKLARYQQASVIRWALIEGGGLFSIVAYLMTGRLLYLAVFAAILVVYLLARPSRARCVAELELTPSDREALAGTPPGQRA